MRGGHEPTVDGPDPATASAPHAPSRVRVHSGGRKNPRVTYLSPAVSSTPQEHPAKQRASLAKAGPVPTRGTTAIGNRPAQPGSALWKGAQPNVLAVVRDCAASSRVAKWQMWLPDACVEGLLVMTPSGPVAASGLLSSKQGVSMSLVWPSGGHLCSVPAGRFDDSWQLIPGTWQTGLRVAADGLAAQLPSEVFDRKSWAPCANGRLTARDLRRAVTETAKQAALKAEEACTSIALWLQLNGFDVTAHVGWHWLTRSYEKYWLDFMAGRYEQRMKFVTAFLQARYLDETRTYPPPPDFLFDRHVAESEILGGVPAFRAGLADTHFLGGSAYVWLENIMAGGRRADAEPVLALKRLELANAITGLKKRQPEVPHAMKVSSTAKWQRSIFGEAAAAIVLRDRDRILAQARERELEDALRALPHPARRVRGGPAPQRRPAVLPTPDTGVAAETPSLEPGYGPKADYLFIRAFRGVVEEIVTKMDLESAEVALPLPSTKARLGWKRADGGGFGSWRSELERALDLRQTDKVARPEWLPADREESWLPPAACPVLGRFVREGGETVELSGVLPEEVAYVLRSAVKGDIVVTPTALAEPFKVRMISAGSATPYLISSVLQKAMHRGLQRLPEFRLTKETPDNDAGDILTRSLGARMLQVDEYYVSGDYTAATDNLDPRLSSIVVDVICDQLRATNEVRELLRRGLVGHKTPEGLTQRWGQLMGSPTSFPILCICNLALTVCGLRSVEGADKRPIGASGIVVNGDDIAFKARLLAISAWRDWTAYGGLSPSVGKNFVSRDFVQINSKMFRLELLAAVSQALEILPPGLWPPGMNPTRARYAWRAITSHSLQVLAPPRDVSFGEFCLMAPNWAQTLLAGATGAAADRVMTVFLQTWADRKSVV